VYNVYIYILSTLSLPRYHGDSFPPMLSDVGGDL